MKNRKLMLRNYEEASFYELNEDKVHKYGL